MSLSNEMIVLIKMCKFVAFARECNLYTCIRVNVKLGIHPLISTDFHNVGLAIKNELADTSL